MADLNNIFAPTQYHFNPYSIGPLVSATLVLIFGFFLTYVDRRASFNRALLGYCLGSALWLYSCVLILNARNDEQAAFWAHPLYGGFLLVPATVYHLAVRLTQQYPSQKYFVRIAYGLVLCTIPFPQSPYFFSHIKLDSFGYYPVAGYLHPVILASFGIYFLASFGNLIRYHFFLTERWERQRTKLFMFIFFVMAWAVIDVLASYDSYLYPSGFIAFLGFIVGMTCFKLMAYQVTVEGHAQDLEEEVKTKTEELSHTVDDLRTMQFKILETGKKSAIASLSAGILHQISQPITAIHGFARFLKKEMKPSDIFYKPICHIEEQSVYIKRILEDLMELIRHREIKKENIDINVVIKRAMNLLTDELRIRRVNWDLKLGDNLPLLQADSIHLQQIFMNLVVNALQAMEDLPRGTPRFLKIASDWDNPRREIVVSFQDTGRSLSPEDRKILKEPYFSTKSKASAIGLALCQDLITEHGGRIEWEDSPSEGTVFFLRFPVTQAVQPAAVTR